jgi:hypothetical protein
MTWSSTCKVRGSSVRTVARSERTVAMGTHLRRAVMLCAVGALQHAAAQTPPPAPAPAPPSSPPHSSTAPSDDKAFANARFSTVLGAQGVPLNVVESGDPSLPAILLIHGFRQSYLSWIRQFGSELVTRCHLVAFDLRGHPPLRPMPRFGRPSVPIWRSTSKRWARRDRSSSRQRWIRPCATCSTRRPCG